MEAEKKQCMRCMAFYDRKFDVCPYCGYEEDSAGKELLHIDPGTVLADRYVVGNALGFGGFGVTYIGYDRKLLRKVAIKEYLPSEFATRALHRPEVMINNSEKKIQQFSAGKSKFLDEAGKLAKLGNLDGIVHIYDSFEENNTAYIVMEYLEGETLADYMKREKKLPEEEAVGIVLPILQTLKEVHASGIIHRDIAPDNIFFVKGKDDATRVKLIDFGASRYASTSHSKSLTVLIKPGYSPAEQYQSNGEQGPFTDIYALAAVLYHMVTGIRPVDAFERRTQVQSGKKDPLKDPSCYNDTLSENFENALMNAMSIRVEDRTESAEAFYRELTSGEPVKRRVSSIRRIDFMKWPLWAKIGVPASAVAVITLIVLLSLGIIGFKGAASIYKLPEGMTRVPDMINADIEKAQGWLDKANLQATRADMVYSPGLPENVVLAQDVSAGSVVLKNTIISLTVSTGKEVYLMPDLTGMTAEYAKKALSCMGITVTVTDGEKAGVSSNCIISQSAAPYTEVGTGDSVELIVSKNPKGAKKAVPQLVGLTYDSAVSAAADAGITLKVTKKTFSQDCDAPVIKSQSVQKGKTAGSGGTVSVKVNLPWHSFQMPSLRYKTKAEAVQILKNMGVQVKTAEENNETVAAGLVFAQDKEKGAAVEPNETVSITLSKGGASFAMPSVAGMTESEARKALLDAGLSVETEYSEDAGVKPGHVISQSIAADTAVTRGTAVNLVVSSEKELIFVASVVGMDRAAAESAIKGQNLRVTVNQVESAESQKGLVIRQLPEAGSSQEAGTTIVLTVGKGGAKDSGTTDPDSTPTPSPTPTPTKPSKPDPVKTEPGPWSDWSAKTPPSGNYEVQEKTQYSYRDKETTSSTDDNLSGWTMTDTTSGYGDWGGWSDWSTNPAYSSDTRQVDTRTTYMYCYFFCYNCGNHWHGYGINCFTWGGGCGISTIQEGSYREVWGPTPQSQINWQDWHGTGHRYTAYNGERVFRNINTPNASRTEYRYCDRPIITTYYYERWGDWSAWSGTAVSGHGSRQVETRTVYRYRTAGT